MVTNHKATGKASSMPAGLAWGTSVSMGITLAAAAIMAKLLDAETIMWENIGYGVMVLLIVSSFLGANVAYSKVKRQRLLICLLSGATYFAVLLSLTALFFGGQYEAVGVTAALVLAGCGTAGLLGMYGNGGGKGRKSKFRYR